MLMTSRSTRTLLWLPLLLSTFMKAQDACKDILSIGLRDAYDIAYSSNLDQSLRDWACSEHSQDYWDSHSGGVAIGYAGYSVAGNKADSDGGSIHVKDCREFTKNLSSSTAQRMAATVLDPLGRL